MSPVEENTCDCIHFDEGDWVESRLNKDVFGIVVGEADFGRYYNVQLAGSLEIKPFHAVTLQHMAESDEEAGRGQLVDEDNIIDFTKERQLRKSTKTRGAA